MQPYHLSTPYSNVFYFTWLADCSDFGVDRDKYIPSADYVTDSILNDERLISKISFLYEFDMQSEISRYLRSMLYLYVNKQCAEFGAENMQEYFQLWLNHTILITASRYPKIPQWCTSLNIEAESKAFQPPKYIKAITTQPDGSELMLFQNTEELLGTATPVPEIPLLVKNTPLPIELQPVNHNISQKDTLTTKEAAQYLNLKTGYLYKLTSSKQIPFYKPGGKMNYFKRTELDQWLTGNRNSTIAENEQKAADIIVNKKSLK